MIMTVDIPFQKHLEFEYGRVDQLSPLVRRVIANNPSAFTFYGTGTYIVGCNKVAIIDPGPADSDHINAILKATRGETITHILVTHTHLDHSPGCVLLQKHTDAKTYAFGKLESESWSLTSVFSPGHAANHLSFYLPLERALFCGDAVMGWSTTIVSPPDGNMVDYMHTLDRLLARDDDIYYPTHGAPITAPANYVQALYDHRLEREQQVIDCVAAGVHSINSMLPVVYSELDPAMYPAAARSLLATIECLVAKRRLHKDGENYFLSSP